MSANALKLATYFGERDRAGGRLVSDALLDVYGRAGIEVSLLLRGAEGFGLRQHLRTGRLLSLSEDLPVVSVAVDTRARIEGVLDEVSRLKRRGLVTLERTRLLCGDSSQVVLPEELREAAKLTVFTGRQERVAGKPAFMAICDLLHRRGVAGASVLLGVDGTLRGCRQRGRFFSRNAEVPMMVIAVGSGDRIARVLPELAGLLSQPLMTLERVRICKRDGELLERPHALPAEDERGMAMWQKLTIYTAEDAKHGRRPIHSELIRRLRAAEVAGATSLRGVWGFHGDHAPHGDRLLQLRRRVPVVTVVIDTPGRIAASFGIVDELTASTGMVISEMVPAAVAIHEKERRGGLHMARHRL